MMKKKYISPNMRTIETGFNDCILNMSGKAPDIPFWEPEDDEENEELTEEFFKN